MKRLFALAFSIFVPGLAFAAPYPCPSAYQAVAPGSPGRIISLNALTLDSSLQELIREANRPDLEALPKLLRMGLENSMQHGVEDLYMPFPAAVRVQVVQGEKSTEIFLTNDLFKKFPQRLECEFHPGESLVLSREERPAPCGFGIGLKQMFAAFASFPRGSDMSWATHEGKVTFRLAIPKP